MKTNTLFSIFCIGENKYILKGEVTKRYLLLPIEDKAELTNLSLVVDNKLCQQLKVRLANKRMDYVVPVDLQQYKGQVITLVLENINEKALCWQYVGETDVFNRTNKEKFRPVFHFSPDYGWMNDPNGMFYKDGVYHLCFQYNPYGSTWENMSWGHATSNDLVTWRHEPDVLHRDGFGDMFSGGAIVDTNNDAGFGHNAVIAFYTNAGVGQMQCIAYSLDDGKTFTKYKNNPILTSPGADFRDPKVSWHKDTEKWIMLLAVDQHMEIYSSANLLDWDYESSFGHNEGAHGGVWECPDLFELPVEGADDKFWVLLCNINPGGPFGGSATQYFVGSFDGQTFVNHSPSKIKWMDYGKDYYATVTWANAPDDRVLALGWMSNWQYANQVPTQQFRSASSIPRDLILFRENDDIYLKSIPVVELEAFSHSGRLYSDIDVPREYVLRDAVPQGASAYSLNIDIASDYADTITLKLFNDVAEEVTFTVDIQELEFRMSRAKSGLVDFDPSHTFVNDTTSPIHGGAKNISLRILVDTCSIEVFGNGGKFTMTNLVFPQEPYRHIRFYSKGGSFRIDSIRLNSIEIDKNSRNYENK